MNFNPEFQKGRLLRRYKRFFADIEVDRDGEVETIVAHCPNTGSMRNCLVIGSECWFSASNNPKRKLKFTLEAVTSEYGGMAGVNTARANALVWEALESKRIAELAEYAHIQKEVRFGEQNSRLDFRLSTEGAEPDCLLEVKSVTLGMGDGLGMFPDAVTARGRKHLEELMLAVQQGHRAVLLFCVQHTHIERLEPAWERDPEYCKTLGEAMDAGIEVLAYKAVVTPQCFKVERRIPFDLARPSGR